MRFKKIQRAGSPADTPLPSKHTENSNWSKLDELVGVNSKIKLRSLQGHTILNLQITVQDFDDRLYRSLIGAYEGDIVRLETQSGTQDFLLIEVH